MTATWTLLLAVAVVLVALTVAWSVSRARRLDRLHVRLDAARAALTAALDSRAVVAARVGVGAPVHGDGRGPAGPRRPGDGGAAALAVRAAAESGLTRRLAAVDRRRLDPGLRAQLVDAEQLVVVARRVHNDAVRDTLALRSRRLVRWLRLAGTAPRPQYFDIAEPDPDVTQRAPARFEGSRRLG